MGIQFIWRALCWFSFICGDLCETWTRCFVWVANKAYSLFSSTSLILFFKIILDFKSVFNFVEILSLKKGFSDSIEWGAQFTIELDFNLVQKLRTLLQRRHFKDTFFDISIIFKIFRLISYNKQLQFAPKYTYIHFIYCEKWNKSRSICYLLCVAHYSSTICLSYGFFFTVRNKFPRGALNICQCFMRAHVRDGI